MNAKIWGAIAVALVLGACGGKQEEAAPAAEEAAPAATEAAPATEMPATDEAAATTEAPAEETAPPQP